MAHKSRCYNHLTNMKPKSTRTNTQSEKKAHITQASWQAGKRVRETKTMIRETIAHQLFTFSLYAPVIYGHPKILTKTLLNGW